MKRACLRRTIVLAWVSCCAITVCAQDYSSYDDPNDRPRDRGRDRQPESLFFTRPIMNLVIDRITEELSHRYDFDEDQLWTTRELLKDRFPDWFLENRGEVIQLANEYIEVVIGNEPPSPEQVAVWAERVQPLMSEFNDMVVDTTEDMRPYLTEEQRVILDAETAAFNVGMQYMNSRMEVWQAGGYDPETEWPRSDGFRQKERERVEQLREEQDFARQQTYVEAGAMGMTPQEYAAAQGRTGSGATAADGKPKDDWERYVDAFIQRYDLNKAQKNQAYRILRSRQKARDRYLSRKLDDINELQARLKSVEAPEEREQIRARFQQLNEPLERYFQDIKDKLEGIPTRAQRQAAAKKEMEARAKSEKNSESAESPSSIDESSGKEE